MPHKTKPTDPTPPPPDLDLFGQPVPDAAVHSDDDGEQPGVNQDHGLTLSGDEWADIEAVWDERCKAAKVPEQTAPAADPDPKEGTGGIT